jgi:hypothetical protein
MENGAPDRRRAQDPGRVRKVDRFGKTLLDSFRGIVIFGIGVFLLIAPLLNFVIGLSDFYRYSFSGLCLLYGGWRIYRGYKQNYY